MKNILCKLKNSKHLGIAFALSLALALLLSGMKPIEAKADDIIPSYTHLVSNAVSYACFYYYAYVDIAYSTADSVMKNEVSGKYYLLVFNEDAGSYQKKVELGNTIWQEKAYYYAKFLVNNSNGGDEYTLAYDNPEVYVLSTADGTGVWLDGNTSLSNGKTYTNYVLGGSTGRVEGTEWRFKECGGSVPIYYNYHWTASGGNSYQSKSMLVYEPPETRGNATEVMWDNFIANTEDFIGYHYLTENGSTLWKEIRFNHDVYPYWEQDVDGIRKLMVYAPYDQTIYMTKDVGRYVEDGIYDYYISTIERTDEHCIQPYAWYTDYQPDTSAPDKVFEVIVHPYIKDGWGAEANSERTLIEVYDSKEDAILAYNNDYDIIVTPTPDPNRPVNPEPSLNPLPPTDDSDNMGFVEFLKQFENLFNASGNMWKIMFYCWAFLPQQILWLVVSAFNIFIAVMVIKWVRS